MMKRYITLSLFSLMAAVNSFAQEAFTVDGISYLPTGATTASVTACSLEEGALAIIPESVEGYTVTAIAAQAFANSPVAAVYMPSTVTTIGEGAFQGCGATFIKLSPNATTIGASAFQGCHAIGHIDLPNELQRLEKRVLVSTPIYTFGDTQLPRLNYIGDYAVAGTQLQHLPVTDAVTYLGEGAFSGSNLQEIHLPASMTAIPDYLLNGCPITEVTLPTGVSDIGRSAFEGTLLNDINLTHYRGKIGIRAFNGCPNLSRLALHADNPHCYTSEDGKVLYARKSHQLISVLPTVERLTIPYPASGSDVRNIPVYTYQDPETGEEITEYQKEYTYILDGTFNQLQQLELPHSWRASLGVCEMPALTELTIRTPAEMFPGGLFPPKTHAALNLYVFSYAMDAVGSSPWQSEYTTLNAIERPTEQLYMAEVLPMYDNMRLVEEGQAILWDTDWNAAIEEAYPQYFTAGTVAGRDDYKSLFRNYMGEQYMNPDKFNAFKTVDDDIIQCIDGKLRFAKGFEVNNYTNWFLHTNFIPATSYIPNANPMSPEYSAYTQYPYQADQLTQCDTFAAAPEWEMPVSEYGLFSRVTGQTKFTFALHMVPGVAYNIYAVVPPIHPLSTEEIPCKNRIKPTFYYISEINEETGVATPKTLSYKGNLDVLFESGKVDTLLIFENVEVISDVYNLLTIQSNTITSSLARQGYTTSIPLIGILCAPQSELEVYPDAVQGIKQNTATIEAIYDASGRKQSKMQRGLNILRMSDGTTKKVLRR